MTRPVGEPGLYPSLAVGIIVASLALMVVAAAIVILGVTSRQNRQNLPTTTDDGARVSYPVIPIRWQRHQPRAVREDVNLAEHPLEGTLCATCDQPMRGESLVAIVAVGPSDPDTQQRHEAGRWYAADGVLTHAGKCAKTFDPTRLAQQPSQPLD
jgi:hypothetical protein